MNGPESQVVVDFVNFALKQDDRTGICEILGKIAVATDSIGAILWELDPSILLQDPRARMFTAGHWFTKGRFAAHDLSVHESLAGRVLKSGRSNATTDVPNDDQSSKSADALAFYRRHKIAKFQAAPVCFVDGRPGVLEVFRTREERDFTAQDRSTLETFCSLLPGVHDALHRKVSLQLIDRVKDILQGAKDGLEDPRPLLLAICEEIQDCFHLIEASVFLEDPSQARGEFQLRATTCDPYISRTAYRAGEAGKTSWALTAGKAMSVWDLRFLKRDNVKSLNEKSLIGELHPGLIWDDSASIESATYDVLGLPKSAPETALPPLSFVAEPVFSAANLRGVLRCRGIRDAPYYFTHRERSLLALIASQIGQFWAKWLDRATVRQENAAWSGLVESIRALNYSVNSELRRQSPDVLNVFRKALHATANTIPGGEIGDIRLFDPKTEELYFALTRGDAWTEEKRRLRFPVKTPPQSAGAKVYQSGQTFLIRDVQQSPYKATFPHSKSMIIAPIRLRNEIYGVLDIRSTGFREFPPYAQQMAELLGQQLGLYHALIDTVRHLREVVGKLQEAEGKLLKETRDNQQAFADWWHQIRGPLNQAHLRLRDAIRTEFEDIDQAPMYLKIQRGLLAKARRASQGLRLFLDLAQNQKLIVRTSRIEAAWLSKRVLETCYDNRVLAPNRRQVEFNVQTDSFHILDARQLFADRDLLEQAVNNVIDNAFKYSYRQTTIDVAAADSDAWFCLIVSNIGVPLSKAEADNVTIRGWRAEAAQSVVGEGTGIGLWVVEHIMKAHNGRLEVLPTANGRTEVRLLLPWNQGEWRA